MRWWPRNWWPCRTKAEVAEAVEAVEDADRKLAEVQERDAEIRQVVASLEQMRRRNRFGPMIEEAFRWRR